MVVTFVLRLLSERLASGELVGSVEHIGSGEVRAVRGPAELEAFARAALGEEEPEPKPGR